MHNSLNYNFDEFVDITGKGDPSKIAINAANDSLYWAQITVPEILSVPVEKPDIEEINSEDISVTILRKTLLVTPVNKTTPENLEGKKLTGYELIVEGMLCNAVTYTSLLSDQSVHTAHMNAPFSAYIVLPTTISGAPINSFNFDIVSCIEDVYIKDVNNRQIFINVALFLQAVPVIGGSSDIVTSDASENIVIEGVTSTEILQSALAPSDVTWTQMDISGISYVPSAKPDIEQLISLYSKIVIISQRIVVTPTPTPIATPNAEGTLLTGKKLVVEGILMQKVIYTANVPSQSVHSMHFDIPFSALVVIDATVNDSDQFQVDPYIEDIYISAVDTRQTFINTTLFINASLL